LLTHRRKRRGAGERMGRWLTLANG